MQRKKLLLLPINKNRSDVPVHPPLENIGGRGVTNYCYDSYIDNSTGEDVLIIDVFSPAPKPEFRFRLFQTAEKWFSVDNNGKISEKSLFINNWHLYYYKYYPFSYETDTTINKYISKRKTLPISGNGISQISLWQDKIRQNRLQEKYDRIKESTDRIMLEITPVPKSVVSWIDETVMQDSRYMFYHYTSNKTTTAYCSCCGELVEISSVKKGQKVKCPNCKKLCTAKPLKAFLKTNGFEDFKRVAYLQPLKSGRFCLRIFEVTYRYSHKSTACKEIKEVQREIKSFSNSSENSELINIYDYFHDPSYQGGDWRKYSSASYSSYYIYPSNLNKIFRSQPSFNKFHIDYNKIARLCNPINLKGFHNCTNNIEFFMNLINNKLINLARSFITAYGSNGNQYQINSFKIQHGSLRKGCGITKDDLVHLKIINPDIKELDMYFEYQKTGRRIDAAEIKDFFDLSTKLCIDAEFMKKILKYSSLQSFNKFISRLEQEGYFKARHIRYSWENPYRVFFSDYKDYLGFAQLLEYDLKDKNILYPKNFKKAHDDASSIINDKEFQKGELPQIARQFDNYNKMFAYQNDKFTIIPPTRHNDIKQEGQKLDHCVASYARRVAMEETIILFIRKIDKPDTPYFTLNLNPEDYSIIQCRGFHNCSYPKEVEQFINEWNKKIIEPLQKGNRKCQKTAA